MGIITGKYFLPTDNAYNAANGNLGIKGLDTRDTLTITVQPVRKIMSASEPETRWPLYPCSTPHKAWGCQPNMNELVSYKAVKL